MPVHPVTTLTPSINDAVTVFTLVILPVPLELQKYRVKGVNRLLLPKPRPSAEAGAIAGLGVGVQENQNIDSTPNVDQFTHALATG